MSFVSNHFLFSLSFFPVQIIKKNSPDVIERVCYFVHTTSLRRFRCILTIVDIFVTVSSLIDSKVMHIPVEEKKKCLGLTGDISS